MVNNSNLTPSNLEGKYLKIGSHFRSQNITLILHKRKEYTDKKPEYYFMFKHGEGKPVYLSGLYPRGGTEYIIESNHAYWVVNLTDQEAIIKPLNYEG